MRFDLWHWTDNICNESVVSCEHWHVDISVLWTMIHIETWWCTWYLMWLMNIDTLHLALIATELKYYKHWVSNALHFYSPFSLHAMKLMGCCTFISLVSHVYMSAAYSEQYIILFHITMRDILQNNVDRSIIGFTLYCDTVYKVIAHIHRLVMINFSTEIIHNNNILTNTITSRSTLKKKCHWWFTLWSICHYFDYMNINPFQQHVCGITNYSVHELHLI